MISFNVIYIHIYKIYKAKTYLSYIYIYNPSWPSWLPFVFPLWLVKKKVATGLSSSQVPKSRCGDANENRDSLRKNRVWRSDDPLYTIYVYNYAHVYIYIIYIILYSDIQGCTSCFFGDCEIIHWESHHEPVSGWTVRWNSVLLMTRRRLNQGKVGTVTQLQRSS